MLWGVSGALSSGTFTAFAYDELAAIGRQALFGRVVACPVVGWALAGAGIAMAAGVFAGHPVGVVGVAAGFGLLTLLIVVSEIRLQHITPGQLRATVTSVSNVLAELLAVGVFVVFVLTAGLGVGVLVGVLLVLLAPAIARWLPDARQ